MLPLDVLLFFALASAALAITPGPDNLFVLAHSALHGWRTGVLVTLGLCTGLLFHISTVALGVAAVLQTSALAFTALKTVGAAYLLYLAWQAFHAGASRIQAQQSVSLRPRALYGRGIVMNVTNPKVAIFFLAFLPQFADPARGPVWLQIVALGLIFMLVSLLIFCAIAWTAARLGAWLTRSQRAQVWMNRSTGVIFALLALRLALSKA